MFDLLPPNATAAERALSEAIARTGDVPILVREMWNPDTCPMDLLPWLAWAFSVDEWDPSWSEIQKRQTIKKSIEVHSYKGTIGAVRESLAALGYDIEIQEWFRQTPFADPYTFRLLADVDQEGISQAAFTKVIDVVSSTKNLRSHLSQFQLTVRTPSGPSMAAATVTGNEITIRYPFQGLALELDFIGREPDPVSLDVDFVGDPVDAVALDLDLAGNLANPVGLELDFVAGKYIALDSRGFECAIGQGARAPSYMIGNGRRVPRYAILEN